MLILGVFLLALAAGVVSTAFWIREDEVGRGYFQTNALVVLGLLAIVTATATTGSLNAWPEPGASRALFAGFAASLLIYAAIWRERWRTARWLSAVCLLSLVAALWKVDFGARFAFEGRFLTPTTLLLSALVLGWSLVTMLLGHWYLVAPKLNFRHLKRFCVALVGLLALRAVASLIAMVVASRAADPQAWQALISASGWGMFLWVRILWGLLGALLLAVMALHCARRGSNQSATGILYVVVVSIWIGEASALFLLATTGVPV